MTQKQVSNPDLTITLEEVKRDIAMDFNCVNIGIIEAFNSGNQTATVRAALKQVIEIKPDGTKVLQEHPLVLEVPVVVLYGGSAHITFPIAPGDNCLLLFNDRELDEWLYNGGVQTPQFPRAHDFSDAIAIVGLRSFQNSIANYLANGLRLAFNGTSKIDITSNLIESIATQFIHNGSMRITENLEVVGEMYGEGGGVLTITSDITQTPGKELKAGNGATGTFNIVQVQNGIVVGGS